MSTQHPLLLELHTEELPAHEIPVLLEALCAEMMLSFSKKQLALALPQRFATPRRLALLWDQVPTHLPAQAARKRGPAVLPSDTKNPSPALLGFCRSQNTEVALLIQETTPKGTYWMHEEVIQGPPLAVFLQDTVPGLVQQLPSSRKMRYPGSQHAFLRPVRGLTVMHGDQIVPLTALGCHSQPFLQGHRFLCDQPLLLNNAAHYEALLEDQGYVVPCATKRRKLIEQALHSQAQALGAHLRPDPSLLEEITFLTEWPQVLAGSFDASFLKLPACVPVTVMKVHQRYVPLYGEQGQLTNTFLFVANAPSQHPEQLIQGNERVLSARLSDASYFWNTDRQKTLEEHAQSLNHLTVHARLGSMADKVLRMAHLAHHVIQKTDPQTQHTPTSLLEAAMLAKADLNTLMVREFPELQGTMGRAYALEEGRTVEISQAIEEHHQPRHASDAVPESSLGLVLALADKTDTLVGFFGLGLRPSGTKDPFALRRAMLGLLKIIQHHQLPLSLNALWTLAATQHQDNALQHDKLAALPDFAQERLKVTLLDQGFSSEIVQAVLGGAHNDTPVSVLQRCTRLQAFLQEEQAPFFLTTYKRLAQFLKKQPRSQVTTWDPQQLKAPQEQALWAAHQAVISVLDRHPNTWPDPQTYLKWVPELENFFEAIHVMADPPEARDARLGLLHDIHERWSAWADFSALSL